MEVVSEFFEFEIKHRLFEIKDKHGLRPWEGVRYYVLNSITRQSYHSNVTVKKKTVFARLNQTVIRMYHFLFYFVNHRDKDFFFFLCSRDKKGGVIFDKIADSTYNLADKRKCYTIESTDNYSLANYKYGKDVSPNIIDIVIRFFHWKYDFNDIYILIKSRFPQSTITLYNLNEQYNLFVTQYFFYKKLFKLLHTRKIFLVQNDIQKGIMAAANDNGINLIEFQHGQISYNHPAYSYPKGDFLSPNNYYHPNYLLTFGPFWSKKRSYPGVNDVVIGNDSYAESVNVVNTHGNKRMLVISNNVEGALLAKRVRGILEKDSSFHFFFKLHPNQYDEFDWYYKLFEKNSQVEVISNQKNINELLLCSEGILLNQSTVELEALRMGRKVFVFTEQLYEQMDYVLDENGVFPCCSEEDFLLKYKESQRQTMEPRDDLFVPFRKEVANHFLS